MPIEEPTPDDEMLDRALNDIDQLNDTLREAKQCLDRGDETKATTLLEEAHALTEEWQ